VRGHGQQELPSALRRSPHEAQDTWVRAHDSAVERHGEGDRAHRAAYSALRDAYEQVGDHWERKGEPHDAGTGAEAGGGRVNPDHLHWAARRLDIPGRAEMDRGELLEAVRRASTHAD
jgi:cation transport regulator ChaB